MKSPPLDHGLEQLHKMGSFNLGNKKVTDQLFRAMGENPKFAGTELLSFQETSSTAFHNLLFLGKFERFPNQYKRGLDALVAWNCEVWTKKKGKMPDQQLKEWMAHPIYRNEIDQNQHVPSTFSDRSVAVHLQSKRCPQVEILLASLHLISKTSDEDKKLHINRIINFYSFYAIAEKVQVILGCDINFNLNRVLGALTKDNANALKENGVQVEVFFPNENERKEANDTGVNPIDGFIVISLTGVHIIHKGQVPCRLNIEKPTMWNRNTDLSCKPPVSFDHNPVFTEFSFMSDIELVRQECVLMTQRVRSLEGKVAEITRKFNLSAENVVTQPIQQQQQPLFQPQTIRQQQHNHAEEAADDDDEEVEEEVNRGEFWSQSKVDCMAGTLSRAGGTRFQNLPPGSKVQSLYWLDVHRNKMTKPIPLLDDEDTIEFIELMKTREQNRLPQTYKVSGQKQQTVTLDQFSLKGRQASVSVHYDRRPSSNDFEVTINLKHPITQELHKVWRVVHRSKTWSDFLQKTAYLNLPGDWVRTVKGNFTEHASNKRTPAGDGAGPSGLPRQKQQNTSTRNLGPNPNRASVSDAQLQSSLPRVQGSGRVAAAAPAATAPTEKSDGAAGASEEDEEDIHPRAAAGHALKEPLLAKEKPGSRTKPQKRKRDGWDSTDAVEAGGTKNASNWNKLEEMCVESNLQKWFGSNWAEEVKKDGNKKGLYAKILTDLKETPGTPKFPERTIPVIRAKVHRMADKIIKTGPNPNQAAVSDARLPSSPLPRVQGSGRVTVAPPAPAPAAAPDPTAAAPAGGNWIDKKPQEGRVKSLLDNDKEEFVGLMGSINNMGGLAYTTREDVNNKKKKIVLTSNDLTLNKSRARIQVWSLNQSTQYGVAIRIFFVDPKTNEFYKKPSWLSTISSTNWDGFSNTAQYLNLPDSFLLAMKAALATKAALPVQSESDDDGASASDDDSVAPAVSLL